MTAVVAVITALVVVEAVNEIRMLRGDDLHLGDQVVFTRQDPDGGGASIRGRISALLANDQVEVEAEDGVRWKADRSTVRTDYD